MIIADNFKNALFISNGDPGMREELVNAFRGSIAIQLQAEHIALIGFKDTSFIILDMSATSVESYEAEHIGSVLQEIHETHPAIAIKLTSDILEIAEEIAKIKEAAE